jgi:YHS domain-containing protein
MIVCLKRRVLLRTLLAPAFLATILGLLGAPSPAHAGELIDQTLGGIAIQGYDPVAYFTDGQAIKGSVEFSYGWLGSTWQFANAEHRDRFAADPVKYAPQYGGYCASGMAIGQTSSADPKAWRIVDGKLYLMSSPGMFSSWADDAPEEIKKADTQWELLKPDLTQ